MTPPETHDEPTVVEDLLLLLFQPRSGTIVGEGTLFYVLGGALLADLSLRGHIQIGDAANARAGRLEAVGARPPDDPLLRSAWEYIGEKPRRVQAVLAAIGPPLRTPVLERLVERGDLNRHERRVLIFRTQTLTEGRTGRRPQLLAAVREALVDDDVEPPARVAALAALVSGSGWLHQFQPEIPWSSPVIARGKDLERGHWGAGAAGEAVTRTVAATVVNSVVVAAATLPPS